MGAQGDLIRILDKETINKIAAGEVIERPASVVKELVDNALDAGATDIRVEVEKGGKTLVLVQDNGGGMSQKDARLSFEKHATSKLKKVEDLTRVSTMGFRGEALSSIAAVAKVELQTRPREKLEGTRVLIEGGKIEEISETGTAPGTTVRVRDLFYNIPARRKYLKSNRTELAHITEIVMKLALANPEISFTLQSEGKTLLRNPGSKELFNTVVNLLGPETARALLSLSETGKEEKISSQTLIRGYISKPELTRGGTEQLFLFVNSRPVNSRALNAAIKRGYYTKIPKSRYPVAVLALTLDPAEVDINVHPQKAEVRLSREEEICEAVSEIIEKTLSEHELVPKIQEKKSKIIQQSFQTPDKYSEDRNRDSDFKARNKVLEKAEPYNYPARDTEKRLKRSERLIEKQNQKWGPENKKEKESPDKFEIKKEGGKKPEEKREIKTKEKRAEEIPEASSFSQAINTASNEITKTTESLNGLRIIGQVAKLYILAEKEGDLVIIDQHAAHERILYEQIRKRKKSKIQELLIPVPIELTPKEKVLMEEYIPFLEEYGFGISEFGENTYVVTFVPEIFGKLEDPTSVHDIISDLLAEGKIRNETGVSEKLCKTLACRAAIKGGAACSLRQMEDLIAQLKKAENPYSCPHGRPTIISFTREELDRRFARTG
ncbi:MAG: DNA mismatch repair endonuclease MutL [Methanosarcinaceae archaeon]|nr:DNA mismatch repair endonuclease MutL [Methanosarcinaceae archaeon]